MNVPRTTAKTVVHGVKWVEEGETFYVVALSPEMSKSAYTTNTRFEKNPRGREEFSCTLQEVCDQTGVELKTILERFTGRGAKDDFALISPRGML